MECAQFVKRALRIDFFLDSDFPPANILQQFVFVMFLVLAW